MLAPSEDFHHFGAFYFRPSWECFAHTIISLNLTVAQSDSLWDMLLSTLGFSGWCGAARFLDSLLFSCDVCQLYIKSIWKILLAPPIQGEENMCTLFLKGGLWCTWLGSTMGGYHWEQCVTEPKGTSEAIWSYSFWFKINWLLKAKKLRLKEKKGFDHSHKASCQQSKKEKLHRLY